MIERRDRGQSALTVTVSLNSGMLWKSSPVIWSASSCGSFRLSRRPMLISAGRARVLGPWCPVVSYSSDACCQDAWQLFKNGSSCCCQFIEQFISPGALMRFIYSSAHACKHPRHGNNTDGWRERKPIKVSLIKSSRGTLLGLTRAIWGSNLKAVSWRSRRHPWLLVVPAGELTLPNPPRDTHTPHETPEQGHQHSPHLIPWPH